MAKCEFCGGDHDIEECEEFNNPSSSPEYNQLEQYKDQEAADARTKLLQRIKRLEKLVELNGPDRVINTELLLVVEAASRWLVNKDPFEKENDHE